MTDLLKDLGISDLSFLPEVPIVSLPELNLGLEDALEGVLAWNPLRAEERLATLTPAWNSILRGLPQGLPEPGLPQPSWQRALEFFKDFRDRKPLEQQTFLPAGLGFLGWVLGSALLHAGIGGLGWYLGKKSPPSSFGSALPAEVEHRRLVLLKESEEVLKDFKEHPEKKAIPFPFPNMHNFLIKIGTLRPPVSNEKLSSWYRDWNRSLATYEKILQPIEDPIQKLYALGTLLHLDYYHHYARGYPKIVNFLNEELAKGNCNAQTQLFFAAVQRLGIQLPEGYGLGAQLFEKQIPGHILPVLYHVGKDGKIDWVLDLVSGKEKGKVVAPILHPVAFYQWFYRGQTGKSILSREELLIENPLPENEEKFNSDAPEDSIIPPPVYAGMEGEGTEDDFWADLIDFKTDEKGNISFRSEIHRQLYESKTSDKEKKRFLLDSARSSFKKFEATPEFKRLQAFLDDPDVVLLKMETFWGSIFSFVDSLDTLHYTFRHFKKDKSMVSERFSLAEQFFNHMPFWKSLPDRIEGIVDRYRQNPKHLLLILNQPIQRVCYNVLLDLRTVSYIKESYEQPWYEIEKRPAFIGALDRVMSDPNQVDWTNDKKLQTPYTPLIPFEDVQVEFSAQEFFGGPTKPKGSQDKKRKELSKEGISTKIMISPVTAFDVIRFFETSNNNYFQLRTLIPRWNDSLREELKRRESSQWDTFIKHVATFMMAKLEPEFLEYSEEEYKRLKALHAPQIRASLQNPFQNDLPPAVQRTLQDIKQRVGAQAYQKMIEEKVK